ncbi:hypothetical protein NP233_g4889 [Leucocoprinus birnbaumii]|uniref:Uncharacterized protein n=1 Tax=Leucocoprinus birnbaumii TaxID=56174 RepID=A0AAD5VTZ6_9AGAR|nr:hypothetical protein NP233_g4889 [Leucocoprinus birnbaumii]
MASPMDYECTWLHLLPLDIARLVFEKTMEDSPMPIHLSLVSRQVQHWYVATKFYQHVHPLIICFLVPRRVEPFIYRHLVFRDSITFRLFYRTFCQRRHSPTKSTAFFAEHVKTLYVLRDSAASTKQMIAIGRCLKSLRSVAGWDFSWGGQILSFLTHDCSTFPGVRIIHTDRGFHFTLRKEREAWRDEAERQRRAGLEDNLLRGWLGPRADEELDRDITKQVPGRIHGERREDPFPYKDLRRMSISVYALRPHRITLAHRMFRDITHLDIYYSLSFDWSSLTSMKHLTHIAVDMLTHARDLSLVETKEVMEELNTYFKAMPQLKAIIFACIEWWNAEFDIHDDAGGWVGPLNCSTDYWEISGPLIADDEYHLHYFTQLCLGMHDPRIVLGTVSDCLPDNHLLKEYLIDFNWPKNSYDWDFSIPAQLHRESWDRAEDIIERRKMERMERRRKAGKGPWVEFDIESERVEGEFGYADAVRRRWNEAHPN